MKAIALLCGVLSVCIVAAQQSTIKGVVSIHNSETLTGKKQYVSNAQVEDEFGKATPQLTNAQGQFQLIFVSQADKSGVSFLVSKPGLQVVNQSALLAIAGQQDRVSISMANPDSIAEYRRRIYNVGKTEGEKRLEYLLKSKTTQLAELRKNASQNSDRIKKLEAELGKLDQEGKGLEQQVKELARKYAPVNLDDASLLVRNAFRLFQNGLVDSAVQLLQAADLKQNVQAVLDEREKIAAIRQETSQREAKANQAAKGYAEALQLKAELHKLKYELDSVTNCYELLIQLDTASIDYLLEYAFYLEWINYYDKAILQTQKALTVSRQLAQNDLHRYEPDVAKVLNRLGVYYLDNSEYAKAETAFLEAVEIQQRLAKENPALYEPALAETKSNMGYLYWNETKLPQAEKTMTEALTMYGHLTKTDAKRYEPELAKVLDNLGTLYSEAGNFTSAEPMLSQALAIRKHIATEVPGAVNESDLSRVQDDLGTMYKNKGDYDKAEMAFKEALTIRQRLAKENPQSYDTHLADTYNNYASVFWARKEYPKAIESYKKALDIFSAKAKVLPAAYQKFVTTPLQNLGQIYLEIKDFTAAKQVFTTGLQIGDRWVTEYPEAYADEYVEAARRMTTLIMMMPDSLLAGANRNEAIEQMNERIVAMAKAHLAVEKYLHHYFGDNSWFACVAGQFAWAEKFALKAMQLDVSQTWVQTNLAHALLFQGKYNAAEKQYLKLKSLTHTDGKSFSTICLEDLAVLEAAGFTSPYQDKIKALLKK